MRTRQKALKMISDIKKRIKKNTGKSWNDVNRKYVRSNNVDWVAVDCRIVVALNSLIRDSTTKRNH